MNLNWLDTSEVTDMSESIMGDFDADVSLWDVSKVRNMSKMFYNNGDFGCDLSGWDVSNVTDMTEMFGLGSKIGFEQISKWGWRLNPHCVTDGMVRKENGDWDGRIKRLKR